VPLVFSGPRCSGPRGRPPGPSRRRATCHGNVAEGADPHRSRFLDEDPETTRRSPLKVDVEERDRVDVCVRRFRSNALATTPRPQRLRKNSRRSNPGARRAAATTPAPWGIGSAGQCYSGRSGVGGGPPGRVAAGRTPRRLRLPRPPRPATPAVRRWEPANDVVDRPALVVDPGPRRCVRACRACARCVPPAWSRIRSLANSSLAAALPGAAPRCRLGRAMFSRAFVVALAPPGSSSGHTTLAAAPPIHRTGSGAPRTSPTANAPKPPTLRHHRDASAWAWRSAPGRRYAPPAQGALCRVSPRPSGRGRGPHVGPLTGAGPPPPAPGPATSGATCRARHTTICRTTSRQPARFKANKAFGRAGSMAEFLGPGVAPKSTEIDDGRRYDLNG